MKLSNLIHISKNMGLSYLAYRSYYELKKKTGILKKQFPINVENKEFISLQEFRKIKAPLSSLHSNNIEKYKNPKLKEDAERILSGEVKYFSSEWHKLNSVNKWHYNHDSNYSFDSSKHFSEINDISSLSGDIKYVWEASRFSYFLTLIRYDHHFETDSSEFIFNTINEWIDNNLVNKGPNWFCSQEISIRIFNWTFALYYYKDSNNLTEELWNKIQNTIYYSLLHVYQNINFSRYTVRNNHAITETLCLSLSEIIYPFIPETKKWSKLGRDYFEKEIKYQIYNDGTFLQFSMNYHRVVIQLLSLALSVSENANKPFSKIVYEKAEKSLKFLYNCMDIESGFMPNYGSNDGALFFPLSNNDYRDFRPQLNALNYILNSKHLSDCPEIREEAFWFKESKDISTRTENIKQKDGISSYKDGGYYLIRENDTLIFIRCGNHKDRPAQADNLHIDLWHKGKNLLTDSGSYKYNTTNELRSYFMGTKGHNTVSINGNSQMNNLGRFIWLNWTQCLSVKIFETENEYIFEGEIEAFRYLDKNASHKRKVIKYKNKNLIEVIDNINSSLNLSSIQHWHIDNNSSIKLKAYINNERIQEEAESYISYYYGKMESNKGINFAFQNTIKTLVEY